VSTYRTGRHWGVTIVREGVEPIEMGKRADDVAAIKAGSAIVCYAKCWPCQFGQCTDQPHAQGDEQETL
jgi:hypothetical protein